MKMTTKEFNEICQAALVAPAIAMESETVRDALKAGCGPVEMFEILCDEF